MGRRDAPTNLFEVAGPEASCVSECVCVQACVSVFGWDCCSAESFDVPGVCLTARLALDPSVKNTAAAAAGRASVVWSSRSPAGQHAVSYL